MKRGFFIVLLHFFTVIAFSQNTTFTDPSYKWRMGFNIGSIWQCSDVRTVPGLGGGFTLERILAPQIETNIKFAFRGRYLGGHTYGRDLFSSAGILNNIALNGTRYYSINYDTVPGYVFQNHQTKIREWSLEGVLYFDKLRQKTNVIFYLFGGIGVTGFETKINQLDAFGNMYDYSLIDESLGISNVRNQLKLIQDLTYESYADNLSGRVNVFSPSFGIGLGYQLSETVSIGFEHKITFPKTDLLDGQQWTMDNKLTLDNDIYHYTTLGIFFYLRNHSQENPDVKKKTQPGVVQPNSKIPSVIVNQPRENPYYSANCQADIIATIKNITSKDQIRVYESGTLIPVSTYNFDPATGILTLNRQISSSSKYRIFAYNIDGNDAKEFEIVCSAKKETEEKVSVTIIQPSTEYYESTDCYAKIIALTTNVSSKSEISLLENDQQLSANYVTFNVDRQEITINRSISKNTTYKITVRNSKGSATDFVTIGCKPKGNSPSIQIITPTQQINNVTDCKASIFANIKNVKNVTDVVVNENGTKLLSYYYSFDPVSGNLKIDRTFTNQATYIIKATNEFGYNEASVVFNCIKQQGNKPLIIIDYPETDPFEMSSGSISIKAKVLNVISKDNISISENGVRLSSTSYSFDQNSSVLILNKTISRDTKITISASNQFGSDTKDINLKIKQVISTTFPEVIITSPSVNPYNASDCVASIQAQIKYVESVRNIVVTENGSNVSPSLYSYNASTGIFNLSKSITATHKFIITATNEAGSAKAEVIIVCSPIKLKTPLITITNPTSNPFTANDCIARVTAKTTNINSKSQITITENGSSLATGSFNFNASTGEITITKSITQKTIFNFTAKNNDGTGTATTTIDCNPLATPVISLVFPTSSTYSTTQCALEVKVKITNISDLSQVKVKDNGSLLSPTSLRWDAANLILSFNRTIDNSSSINITATNISGSDDKNIVITCSKAKPNQPTITITNPTMSPYLASDCIARITAKTTNISQKSQISISENGVNLAEGYFNFNTSSGEVSITRSISKQTVYYFTVRNEGGTATSTTTIDCKPLAAPIISLVFPTTSTYSTTNCTLEIKVKIANITDLSQVKVKDNITTLNSNQLKWDASGSILSFNSTIDKSSLINIVATNNAGSDSKTLTINCNKPQLVSPSVTISNPTMSPFLANDCVARITAKTTNITMKSQISITENRGNLAEVYFNFNSANGEISINRAITQQTVYKIIVRNDGGTASANATIDCKPLVAPVISIISPTVNPFMTSECNVAVKAKIENIETISQIKVTDNGVAVSSSELNWNSSTLMLSFNRNVSPKSAIKITATNKTGTVSKDLSLVCLKIVAPPTVKITNPVANPFVATDCKINLSASVQNIDNVSQISVTLNGTSLSSSEYSYNVGSGILTFTKDFIADTKVIVKATNDAGSAQSEANFQCKKPEVKPRITFKNPTTNPFNAETPQFNVRATVTGVTLESQIKVNVNGKVLSESEFVFSPYQNLLAFNTTLAGSTKVTITATNTAGSTTAETTIIYDINALKPVITIIKPNSSPYESRDCITDIYAEIKNISGMTDIKVTENGSPISSDWLSWDAGTKQLRIYKDVLTTSVYEIKATNKNGSDSKTITIVCKKM